MLNTSVSLGRVGIPVSFISEFGQDNVGRLIKEFLDNNGISTGHLFLYNGKSPLSLAFLNERNDASYDFYEDFPERRLDIKILDFKPDDILMFGSILATNTEVRTGLKKILESAKKSGIIRYYDPNLRESLMPLMEHIKPLIFENIGIADIVRASNEDMRMICGCTDPDEAYDLVCQNGCDTFIYTENSKGVHLRTPHYSKHYTVPELETVSTIGAGDNFNAGIAYMMHKRNITDLNSISEAQWDEIIETAIVFASHVCMSTDNYISIDLADRLKKI